MSYPSLRKDTDLGAKRKTVTVDMPELELSITLREMTYRQFHDGAKDLNSQFALSIVDDENGELVYESGDAFNEKFVLELPLTGAAVMERLTQAFLTLHGATKEALEEMSKKSEASPDTASVSG
jgi:hypothetical protein